MNISYKWLKDYVDLPDSLSPEEIALKMTMAIVEVEGFKKQGENMENIVLGFVKEINKHSNADKLQIAKVDVGDEEVQIVCGGTNLEQGMKVAVAKVGAKVRWHGEGDLVEMKPAKIRGEESFGMICAGSEIGLENMFEQGETEILDLSFLDVKIGTPISEALGLDDIIFDIDNKSMTHRPDLWGHYGMAREIAAVYNKKLKDYSVKEIKGDKTESLEVEVENKELCPRYTAVMLDGVEISESPKWIQERLIAAGVRPINNIVDITNYVMFDLGQPLHAFDKNNLKSNKIIIRNAKENEKFITLDEKENKLNKNDLVIADEEKAVALAGIMGGLNSGINQNTKTIIFEAANFEPVNLRRTASRLGLRTDSSARFEKSLDPNMTELALKKAVELALEFCPNAKVVGEVVDKKDFSLSTGPIEVSYEFLFEKFGEEIDKKQIIKILESLGFEVKEKKDILYIKIPTWRATKDISIKEDIVEEIARIYGYDNFKKVLPVFPIIPPEVNRLKKLEKDIKNILVNKFAFTESLNYSFVSPKTIEKLGLDLKDYIELDNPIAKDRPYLRRDLFSGLLNNISDNNRNYDELAFFETGKIFIKEEVGERVSQNSDELLPRQDTILSLVYTNKKDKNPFYELSNILKYLGNEFGIKMNLDEAEFEEKYIHAGRAAIVYINDEEKVAKIFELHPKTQKNFEIDSRVAVLEINLNKFLEFAREKNNYKKISPFPPVLRDIAFVVENNIKHIDIVKSIYDQSNLVKKVVLFDIFSGEKIGENKKSMAYHIIFSSDEKTLEAGEVDEVFEKISKELKDNFGAELRK